MLKRISLLLAVSLAVPLLFAQNPAPQGNPPATQGNAPAPGGKGGKGKGAPKGDFGSCQQITDACKKAGFLPGKWKEGDGLWRDCIDPLMQGVKEVKGAKKPLPAVDAKLIADCKAKNPKYGGGKDGSK